MWIENFVFIKCKVVDWKVVVENEEILLSVLFKEVWVKIVMIFCDCLVWFKKMEVNS